MRCYGMMETEFAEVKMMVNIRVMSICDYTEVYDLWINTPGMGLNSTDESREGIERYFHALHRIDI